MFGIGREPAALHAPLLFENLLGSPEAGECENTKEGLWEYVLDKQRCSCGGKPKNDEPPPAPCAEPVMEFDNHGVEQPDYKECADAEQQPGEMKCHNSW